MSSRLARWIVRAARRLVPRGQRADWTREWLAELRALEELDAGEARSGTGIRYPGPVAFALGAVPHALWTRTEGWTMDSVFQDLRYAVRVLARSPGFTLVAALTLALGIGANASIFSLVNGLLFRSPAGVVEPDRLVQIARSYEQDPRWDAFSWPAMEAIRREATTLSGVAGYQGQAFVLGRGAETERILGQVVTGNYFDVLGIRPLVGRPLQPSDDLEPGAHPVVVLSHALWVRRFGSDPGVVGTTVSIGARPYEVVGVAPRGFTGVESVATPPALWVPTMQLPPQFGELPFGIWDWSWIELVGRMRDGVTFQEVQASMDVVSARLREAAPVNEGIRVLVAQGVGFSPDERAQATTLSLLLMTIVGLVLLLTCTNVANLFLARASGRRMEMGVRMALGAGRGRLGRQLVTESLLLGLLATVLAVPLVTQAGRFLPLLFPYTLAVPVGADGSVLAFLLVVGAAAGVLFGAAPAWVGTRRDVTETLREGASTGGRARTRLRDALVVAQLALSLGLVSGAVLLGRSVMNARSASPGFEPRGLLVGFVDLQATGRYQEDAGMFGDLQATGRYEEAPGMRVYRQIQSAAESIPGARSATLSNQTPIIGAHTRATAAPADREGIDYEAEYIVVGPHYFETMGIPITRGRPLGGFDDEPERVVVVNEALARMFWPGEDPIGKELDQSDGWRVVGVAGDVQMRTLREPGRPAVYYPLSHVYWDRMAIQVRGEGGHSVAAEALQEAVASVDPELPVIGRIDLHDALVASMRETRTIGFMVAAFAGLALVLAAVGLYGLVAYGVSQRVREMGIRIAMGAEPGGLVRLVMGRGISIAAMGILVGLAVSYGLGQALKGLLFGVGASDPGTLGAAALLLLAVAALAAWIPARRASRVDAAVSLRE